MRVSATTVIRATPEQVWDYITVPENGPDWQEGAVSTTVTTPGPVRLGSRMDHVGRWLRMTFPTQAVVTVFEPPARYGYDIVTRMVPEPVPMRYVLEPVAQGTRLTLSNDAPVSGWMRLFAPLIQRSTQGMFDRDVARLKARIEAVSRAVPAPAPAAVIGDAAPEAGS